MSKIYYRIANEKTQQGLWYDSKGNFTGLIHNEFNFCMNTNLPMPFDTELVGWLSATDSLEDLFNWFSKEDIKQLEKHGYFITVYKAEKVKQYKNHLVICQETSLVKEKITLQDLEFNKAIEIANQIEEQVKIIMPSQTDYITILKVAKYTVDRMKSVIPMYTGNLNPKWKLYDTVIDVIDGRLNGK